MFLQLSNFRIPLLLIAACFASSVSEAGVSALGFSSIEPGRPYMVLFSALLMPICPSTIMTPFIYIVAFSLPFIAFLKASALSTMTGFSSLLPVVPSPTVAKPTGLLASYLDGAQSPAHIVMAMANAMIVIMFLFMSFVLLVIVLRLVVLKIVYLISPWCSISSDAHMNGPTPLPSLSLMGSEI